LIGALTLVPFALKLPWDASSASATPTKSVPANTRALNVMLQGKIIESLVKKMAENVNFIFRDEQQQV
jgi:hypothetical protein